MQSPPYCICDPCKDYICILECISRPELPTLRYFNSSKKQVLFGVLHALSPGSEVLHVSPGNVERVLVHLCALSCPS